ncbi:MAG: TlpA disulfide reductase family protein [Planctomycetota bacterium]
MSDTTTESTLEAGQGTSATFEPSNVEIPAGGLSLPEGDVPVETPESKAPVDGGMKLPDEFDPTQSSVETQGDGALVASRSPVGTPVELTKVRYAEWASIASLGSTNGRVTVIDYWSLACGPCLKEYPNLVGLAAKYPEKVQAIGVNLDYDGRKSRPPETYEAAVLDFLNAVSADFPNYIAQTPSDDIFRALDIASIPAVMVYSAKGELVGRFVDAGDTKGFTYAKDVLPLVERLLEAS